MRPRARPAGSTARRAWPRMVAGTARLAPPPEHPAEDPPCPTSPRASTRSSPSSSRSIRCSDAHRRARARRAVAGHVGGRTARRLAFADRWTAELRRFTTCRRTTPSTAICSSSSSTRCGSRPGAPRGNLEPARMGLPVRRRAVLAGRPGVRAAGGSPRSVADGSRASRPWSMRLAEIGRRGHAGGALPHREGDRALGGHRGARRRCPGDGEEAAPGDPDVAAVLPRCVPRRAARPALDAFERTSATSSSLRPRAKGGSAPSCSRRRWSTRPLERADAGADQPRRAGVRRRPGRDDPDRGEIWPDWCGGAPNRRTTARPSAPSSMRSPSSTRPDDILDFCRAELSGSRRSAGNATSSDWPTSRSRSAGRRRSCGRSAARCSIRRALDRGQKAFFSVTPIPDDWPEQAESYLREDNDRMLRLLTIHEAVPGHYLQGVYANRAPSMRARSSGAACSPRAGPST